MPEGFYNPPPPRPKNTKKRNKRTTVPMDDGWSVISHSKPTHNSKPSTKRESTKTSPSHHIPNNSSPTHQTIPNLTPEKLLQEFKAMKIRFASSTCAARTSALLRSRKWNLTTAICLAIGSLSRDWGHRKRGMWQLMFFCFVVETIALKTAEGDREMKLYAQDPAFNPLDTQFLEALGFEVLADTAGDVVHEKCFLYAPFLEWVVLLPGILKDKKVGLYVGNEVLADYGQFRGAVGVGGGDEERDRVVKSCNEIGRGFLKGREMVRVSRFEEYGVALEGLVVYLVDNGEV